MNLEYDVKFLDVDIINVKQILNKIKATKIHDRIMFNITIFNRCDATIKGTNVTMTSKIYKDPNFPEEYEVTTLLSNL